MEPNPKSEFLHLHYAALHIKPRQIFESEVLKLPGNDEADPMQLTAH